MKAKAVALLLGGLDSMLAAKVIKDQDIEVVGVNFVTPFFGAERAEQAAVILGIPLEVFDITEAHLAVVKNPKYGYGKNMNPCIDCHMLMVRGAGDYMRQIGGSFIVTGEVLGERLKSQTREALRLVTRKSGYEGYLLRPLSAKLLAETIPEKEGLVDRSKLYGFEGRFRKPQMELAKHLGIGEYPMPTSGCLLTDPEFSKRLKDLLENESSALVNDIELLKWGRHFRIGGVGKAVVGRNEEENEKLMGLVVSGDYLFQVADYAGSLGVLRGERIHEVVILKVAKILARYSDAKELDRVVVWYWQVGGSKKVVAVKPMSGGNWMV